LERFFYHSFPRPDDGVDSNKKGIEILKSIVNYGLLLTPEITNWQERLMDGNLSKPWSLYQKRACFTELPPTELDEHSKHFGPISIEFEIKVLRQLGAIPVFYLPRPTSNEQSLEYLGSAMMARIGEIQQLLDRMTEIESLANQSINDWDYLSIQKSGFPATSTRCTMGGTKDFLSVLRLNSQPLHALKSSLQGLCGFFYPTEDLDYTSLMAYYRQREWRIVGNVLEDGKPLSRELETNEKCNIASTNTNFFWKVKKFRTGEKPRIDECQLFPSYKNIPFIKYARRLIIPSEYVSEVKEFIKQINDDDRFVVASSYLTKK
jgi:hypothetical protein